jgi:hypothetical protein
MNMSDLPIDSQEEQEQETFFGTIVLRCIVMFLCTIIGFGLVLMGYAVALFLDIDIKEFSAWTSAYFIISIGLWVVIGLCTPLRVISSLFDKLKGMPPVGVVIIILVFAIFVLLYWFLITYSVSFIMSVFGVE